MREQGPRPGGGRHRIGMGPVVGKGAKVSADGQSAKGSAGVSGCFVSLVEPDKPEKRDEADQPGKPRTTNRRTTRLSQFILFVWSILWLLLSETKETSSLPRAATWLEGSFDFLKFRMSPFLHAFSVECTSLTRSQQRFTASSIKVTLLDQGVRIPPAGGASQLVVKATHRRVF